MTDQSAELTKLREQVERLKTRLLTAAGDDLCRLTQEEIKDLSSGAVKIPPEDQFIESCRKFHRQIASEVGVMDNCLTLAQLVAENEKLTEQVAHQTATIIAMAETCAKYAKEIEQLRAGCHPACPQCGAVEFWKG